MIEQRTAASHTSSQCKGAHWAVGLCLIATTLLMPGCGTNGSVDAPFNPFLDIPPLAADGKPKELTSEIVPLGSLAEGDVVRIRVDGPSIESVLMLMADDEIGRASGRERG